MLPKTIIKQIDKYRKHCLWRGSDLNSKKPPKAAWPMVTLPKEEGGLGVLNLTVQNECLLLKQCLGSKWFGINITQEINYQYRGQMLELHSGGGTSLNS